MPNIEQPQQQIVVPRSKSQNSTAPLVANNLRMNMWVVNAGVVGIVTGCSADGIAEVTMTKPDGTTRMMLDEHDKAVPATFSARVEDMLQATHDEIPESRRPPEDISIALGYLKGAAS
jgi:hypothetical protein